MTEVLVDFRLNKRDAQRILPLDKGCRDALADLFRRRWPTGTAKNGAREYGLTLDQARSIVAGRASLTSLEQVLKNGGWSVVFPLLAEVIGQSAEQYIIETRKSNEENGERLTALVSSLWALDPRSDARSDDLDHRPTAQRRTFNRRMG